MRLRVLAAAAAAAVLAVVPGSAMAGTTLTDQINDLRVAAEQPGGYPGRDGLNINYDRDALLERNQQAFDNCEGYYSRYDAECHTSEDAVEIDHLVAVKEAWDSGLRGEGAWEDFDGDTSNLAVMTSELNGSKSDSDAAEWTPPHAPSTCHFVTTYVSVKAQYNLTVDKAEKQALLDLAASCSDGGGNDGDKGNKHKGGNDGDKGGRQDDQPAPAPEPDAVENDLAVTG